MMGFTGQVNLGQGAFVAIGGYSAGIASVRLGLPPLTGVFIGVAIAMASASALALVSVHLKGHYLALATLAFGLVVDSLLVGADDFTGGPSGLVGIPSLSIGEWTFDTLRSNYFLVLAIVLVVLLAVRGVMQSNLGRTLQAIRTDQTAAAALGINVRMTRLGVFACCAGLGALAGSLYAFEFHFLSTDMVGTPKSLELVSMLVLGGEATLIGPFFGALLLVVLPDLFQSLAQYKTFLEGLLLMSVFRFLPAGLWGEATRLLVRRARASTPGGIAKAPVPASPALSIRGVSKRFAGLLAVNDVSFDVEEGSTVALIGPNGAGKTTLFNLITNLFRPDQGEVSFHGRSLAGMRPESIASLGLIRTFQSARIFPTLSTLENALVGANIRVKASPLAQILSWPTSLNEEKRLRRQASALIDAVGLGSFRDTAATDLPMGAQKLLEIVRGLMAQPKAILLDEPAAGLNDTETAELGTLLKAVRELGITVVIVEHNMSLVMDIADKVVVLDSG
eukprot:gene24668-26535_t